MRPDALVTHPKALCTHGRQFDMRDVATPDLLRPCSLIALRASLYQSHRRVQQMFVNVCPKMPAVPHPDKHMLHVGRIVICTSLLSCSFSYSSQGFGPVIPTRVAFYVGGVRASGNQGCGPMLPVFSRAWCSSANESFHGFTDRSSGCEGTSSLTTLFFGLRPHSFLHISMLLLPIKLHSSFFHKL